jgi:hypothetical protein
MKDIVNIAIDPVACQKSDFYGNSDFPIPKSLTIYKYQSKKFHAKT